VLQNVSGAISNVAARFKGLELQLQSAVTADLTVSLSGAYVDARIPHYVLAPGVLRDVEPAFTPHSKLVGTRALRSTTAHRERPAGVGA